MSGHSNEHSHDHSPKGMGDLSPAEKLPLIGRAITMLKTIYSHSGIGEFLKEMVKWSVGVSLRVSDFIGHHFGAKGLGGGGGGGSKSAPAH